MNGGHDRGDHARFRPAPVHCNSRTKSLADVEKDLFVQQVQNVVGQSRGVCGGPTASYVMTLVEIALNPLSRVRASDMKT